MRGKEQDIFIYMNTKALRARSRYGGLYFFAATAAR